MILHLLTSDEIVGRAGFLERAEALIDLMGERGVFHLRARRLGGKEYLELARRLGERCRRVGGALVVNERVDVAMAAEVDGVQLGRGALSVEEVRKMAPTLQVGVSVHDVSEVGSADDADWAIFGHVFETGSHPGEAPKGVERLREVVAATKIPVIAVGGITPSDVRTIREAGAAGVAVISGIWDAKEPNAAVTDYLS